MSYAGIISLKMDSQVSEIFSVNDVIPSAGQGIISLQCRDNDKRIKSILKQLIIMKHIKELKQKEKF